MKHIQLFENFKSRTDWQVGDIISGGKLKYVDNGNWIVPGEKYEIIGFPLWNKDIHDNTRIRIKCVKNNIIYSNYFETSLFMTEEEWNLKNLEQKYNL
jgi:hypothetical protein